MLSSGGALAMLTNVGLLQLVAVHLRNQGPWVLLYAFVFGTAAVLLLLLRPFLSTASRRFQVFFFLEYSVPSGSSQPPLLDVSTG